MTKTQIPLPSVQKVIGLESIDSTQTLAKELALNGEPEGTLVLANRQTAGRGRYDRSFSSEEGGVYFTLILRPQKPSACNASLSVAVGKALAETLHQTLEIKTKVKLPNDVLAWEEKTHTWKKICGVLIETSAITDANQWMLVGVGVNLNNRLPLSLKHTAISAKRLTGQSINRELFLEEFLENFWEQYAYWLISKQ